MIFKLLGITLVVASSTLIGFLKSKSLVARYKKLQLIYDGIDVLYEHINQGGCELDCALHNSFYKCDFLNKEKGCYSCGDEKDLNRDDKLLINDFFEQIGKAVKSVECDRINSFKFKIKSRLKDAQINCTQKCKVYQTFGICVGLLIGILLI